MIRRLWPRSLQGQVLLTMALALLLAQAIGAMLVHRAQAERREAVLTHTAALRLFAAMREEAGLPPPRQAPRGIRMAPDMRHQITAHYPLLEGERRLDRAETEIYDMLAEQGVAVRDIRVCHRPIAKDPVARQRIAHRREILGSRRPNQPRNLVVAAAKRAGDDRWVVVRVLEPPGDGRPLFGLIAQTLLIYAILVGAIALILRRITRPLAALTGRVERFGATRDPAGQFAPEGPDDIRRLIAAHNGMEDRIAALLDEKDVMLGAIGHDLKTPLAALRVRIENVGDEAERARMAGTIEEITKSLDQILSLARVGRPSEPAEPTELSALVASIAEEYEDLGEPVSFETDERIVLPLRSTWFKSALRNLIGNALRYGQRARVSIARDGAMAAIRVEDDGPGIPEEAVAEMLEPFRRGDPSRSSATGGAGLGLTLARAIAEQHGGALELSNRRDESGKVLGLAAILRLPL